MYPSSVVFRLSSDTVPLSRVSYVSVPPLLFILVMYLLPTLSNQLLIYFFFARSLDSLC
ncbi:hypothetical protein SCHPADRAFT_767178 [Schizopora paradoxa]|uniref:Uncharacterized protein n=1 Tax=Schizopora paradoxa TaxID=27342 RepID=A0A0H2QXR4_9AGAM|nr:hypothetical protein SCHPADRAFT_767178 [Schizopora paradoxa]